MGRHSWGRTLVHCVLLALWLTGVMFGAARGAASPVAPANALASDRGGAQQGGQSAPQERREAVQRRGSNPLAGAPSPAQSPDWTIQRVDSVKWFQDMGPRSLALDAAGHPHVAYGGDRLYYRWYDGTEWHEETVDEAATTGCHTSLVLDAAGRPHISYNQGNCGLYIPYGNLRYAFFDGASWQVLTVTSDVADASALALDAAGRPHVGYCRPDCSSSPCSCRAVEYAYYDGTAWITTTVDSGSQVGHGISLALDAAGRPHLTYHGSDNSVRHAWYDGTAWQTEIVDDSCAAATAGSTSLVLDDAGRPRVSYGCVEFSPPYYFYDVLRYAWYDGAAWQIEGVGKGGTESSLALDSAGLPRIGYVYSSDGSLRYTHYDGTSWVDEAVDGEEGGFPSLALDTTGQPWISYGRIDSYYGTRELRLARYEGGVWKLAVLDTTSDTGSGPDLALDSAGEPHVSYISCYAIWCSLRYAQPQGPGWQAEILQPVGGGTCNSLALDAADRPHMSYCDEVFNLWYMVLDGTGWHTETVDSVGGVGFGASLALDSAGRPGISYYDVTNGDLRYARRTDQGWHVEIVDYDQRGATTSLVLDAAGRPHISYELSRPGIAILKYAYFDGNGWQLSTVDGDGGACSSLALDTAGRPHIAYHGTWPTATLRYASFDGSAWQIETVDGGGEYTSLALDAAGRPQISYRGASGSLKFAFFDGSTWQIEAVDSATTFTALALDAAGQPHIGYYDDVSATVKYAYQLRVPVDGVSISGPDVLPLGVTALYSATVTPPSATLPVTLRWSNSTLGPTAPYSWTVTGTHTLAVTATNRWGQAQAAFSVNVFFQPLQGVEIDGPAALLVGQQGTYYAIPQPVTASRPITFTWGDQTGVVAYYSWATTGTFTLTVTATNDAHIFYANTFAVSVLPAGSYRVYLPVVLRNEQ
jgi:hypothetical protein